MTEPLLQRTAQPPAEGERWTVLRMILWSAGYLADKGVDRARLEAEHLLADTLGTGRMDLYLDFARPLTPQELEAHRPRLLRRGRREPLQYIRGTTAFRNLELATDPRVLIPRPETEELVGEVLSWAAGRGSLRALDVGTGSGCIALSLASEGDFQLVVATDVSPQALEVARQNRDRYRDLGGGKVEFRHGPLLAPVASGETFHVVVSNPPYVARSEAAGLSPEVREWEPEAALFAGDEGLDVVLPLVNGVPDVLAPGGLLALELGQAQTEAVASRLEEGGIFQRVQVKKDLSGRDRFVLAER